MSNHERKTDEVRPGAGGLLAVEVKDIIKKEGDIENGVYYLEELTRNGGKPSIGGALRDSQSYSETASKEMSQELFVDLTGKKQSELDKKLNEWTLDDGEKVRANQAVEVLRNNGLTQKIKQATSQEELEKTEPLKFTKIDKDSQEREFDYTTYLPKPIKTTSDELKEFVTAADELGKIFGSKFQSVEKSVVEKDQQEKGDKSLFAGASVEQIKSKEGRKQNPERALALGAAMDANGIGEIAEAQNGFALVPAAALKAALELATDENAKAAKSNADIQIQGDYEGVRIDGADKRGKPQVVTPVVRGDGSKGEEKLFWGGLGAYKDQLPDRAELKAFSSGQGVGRAAA